MKKVKRWLFTSLGAVFLFAALAASLPLPPAALGLLWTLAALSLLVTIISFLALVIIWADARNAEQSDTADGNGQAPEREAVYPGYYPIIVCLQTKKDADAAKDTLMAMGVPAEHITRTWGTMAVKSTIHAGYAQMIVISSALGEALNTRAIHPDSEVFRIEGLEEFEGMARAVVTAYAIHVPDKAFA